MIRIAIEADFLTIQAIFRQYRDELGRFYPQAMREHIQKREVHVAEVDGQIAGFVDWHRRRDHWSTIYHLAVDTAFHGRGIGRNLLFSVPCPMRLKCTVDNDRANRFYAGAGMELESTETGKERDLHIWRMDILFILVKGGVPSLPELAVKAGMAYGVREDYKAYAWPFMLDVDFERHISGERTWAAYLDEIRDKRPWQAMVVDYMEPSQRDAMLSQVQDLRDIGIGRILVCPKFEGAIDHIPEDCIVALSVPSTYAGWLPDDFRVLQGRLVHLLGGSVKKQHQIIQQVRGAGGLVISVDGNYHTKKAARYGAVYDGYRWKDVRGEDTDNLIIQSGKMVVKKINERIGAKQLTLGF